MPTKAISLVEVGFTEQRLAGTARNAPLLAKHMGILFHTVRGVVTDTVWHTHTAASSFRQRGLLLAVQEELVPPEGLVVKEEVVRVSGSYAHTIVHTGKSK